MDVALSLVGGLALIALIIAANGYFVAQEFSYMAVDRAALKARAERGDKAATRILKITDRTSFMLSGAQLGITVTGLLVGYVAEPLVGTGLGELLGGVGVPDATGLVIGTVAILVLSTFTQMLFGELFPKNLSIATPYPVAERLSRSTLAYMRATGWLITFFDRSAAGLVRLLGIEPVEDVEHSADPRDLQRIVAASQEAGALPPELSVLLDRMLDFPERDVDHALVPRSRVDVLPEDATLDDCRRRMASEHSRYPVLDHAGDVVGVVHVVDVLEALAREGDAADRRQVAELVRPATVVPTLMRLPDALSAMVAAGDLLACVVDEFGGFAGIVTAEDLVEEVVGEITDEHDEDEDPHLTRRDERTWSVRGDAPLDEVARELGHDLPQGDFETVAGLAIARRGALPAEGEVVELELEPDAVELAHADDPPRRLLRLHVDAVERHVPVALRVELVEPAPARRPGRRRRGPRGGRPMTNPWVAIPATLLILVASAVFVSIEFATIASRRTRLEDAATESRSARAALRSASEVSVLLAGCQLGITAATLALGAVTEPAVEHALAPLLEATPVPGFLAHAVAFGIALAVVTFLHLVVGEMAPKSWAISHPERTATLFALPMRGFMWVFRPVLLLLNEAANGLVRRTGTEPVDEVAVEQDPDELMQLVRHSAETGDLDARSGDALVGALQLTRTTVGDLAHDTDPVAVPDDATVADVREASRASGHLRIVVGDPAAPTGPAGVVHVRDTLLADPDQRIDAVDGLVRPVHELDPATTVLDALSEMRLASTQLAVVRGEDGAGVVTIADMLGHLFPAEGPAIA